MLFVGEHTRTIYVPKVAMNTGMGKFAIVKKSCLACKAVVDGDRALCRNCIPKTKNIYIERKLELINYEKTYNDLWV